MVFHRVHNYALVAEVYDEAMENRFAPGKFVAETFGLSEQAAHMLIRRVRASGFLPPAKRGQAAGNHVPAECPTCGASPSRWRRPPTP
jgi:hypothetical protein